MSYFEYLKKNTRPFMVVVLVLFVAFYIAGLWMPSVNSAIEGYYLLYIIGIPLALFFVGNAINWNKRHRK